MPPEELLRPPRRGEGARFFLGTIRGLQDAERPDSDVSSREGPGALASDPDLIRILADVSERRGIRIAALVGALASALWLVAYFLPWIVIPAPQAERVRAQLEPEIEALARTSPEDAKNYRELLHQVTTVGTLAGLDLFHYVRSAYALNRTYQKEAASHALPARSSEVRRAFRAAAWVLAGLPLASVLLLLGLVLGLLRRAGSFALTSLVLVGCTGCALALGWLRVADSLKTDMLWGSGLKLGLGASVAQACAGLFGVTTKNWWRVYVLALLLLAAATAATVAFVAWGWSA